MKGNESENMFRFVRGLFGCKDDREYARERMLVAVKKLKKIFEREKIMSFLEAAFSLITLYKEYIPYMKKLVESRGSKVK